MTDPKLRRRFVQLHLWFAGLLAPAFLLVAVSGGLYLIGNKGEFRKEPVSLPAQATLDFKSATLEADVRALLETAKLDTDFDYVKNRGTVIQLRPTSRTHFEFRQTPNGLEATRKIPNLQASLMELHKGHGPTVFKLYQKFVAIGLIGVVFGGLFVGLLARVWRRQTLIASGVGTGLFIILAFFA